MATYVCDAQTGAEIERTTPINGRLRDDDSMMPMMRSHREHHGVGISRLVVCATFLDIPSFCLEDPVSVSDPLWSLYGSMASIFFAAPPPPPQKKKKKAAQLLPRRRSSSLSPSEFGSGERCELPELHKISIIESGLGACTTQSKFPVELREGYYKSSYRGKVGGLDNSNRCSGYYETVSMVSNPKD